MVHLVNTSAQAETLLQSLERAAASIGLHFNADQTEYMCNISTLDGSFQKLVDKFTNLENSLSLTERDINK